MGLVFPVRGKCSSCFLRLSKSEFRNTVKKLHVRCNFFCTFSDVVPGSGHFGVDGRVKCRPETWGQRSVGPYWSSSLLEKQEPSMQTLMFPAKKTRSQQTQASLRQPSLSGTVVCRCQVLGWSSVLWLEVSFGKAAVFLLLWTWEAKRQLGFFFFLFIEEKSY